MNASHADLKEQAGAYVLGSLDPDEQISFEAHLAGCEECAAEVRSMRAVAVALAQGIPQRTPRAELRQRVLEPLRGRPAVHKPVSGARFSGAWIPLAASLLIALGVAAYAARLQGQMTDLERRLDQALAQAAAAEQAITDTRRVNSELQSAMGVLAAPDLVRIDLMGQAAAPTANARALWSRARGMVFAASNLPPLPTGRVYQVWVVTGPAPVSAGLFMPDPAGAGLVYFTTPVDIPPPAAVAVTLEPAGGVPAPTGNMYLVGKPAAGL
jgi:anti-sigma-K factor RskA